VPAQRFYHSDLADKSVKFWTAPTKARRAVLGRDAKNGTNVRNPSVPYSKCYGMTMSDDYAILFVGANGCAPVIGFQGRLYGMTPLHVILTMLLVRIWASAFYEACTRKMGQTLGARQSLFSLSFSRKRSERLDIALSRSNGLSGERVHDLERSTANHVLQRTADLRTNRDFIIYIQ